MASDATVGFTNIPLTRALVVRGMTPVKRPGKFLKLQVHMLKLTGDHTVADK